MDLLTKSTKKLARNILCWSIPPVKSCLNCAQCKKDCYAMYPYRARPNVTKAWDRNFILAQSGEFKEHVIQQIKKSKTCRFVRIHVAGDFFNEAYVNAWISIARTFPNIKFYSYTKVMSYGLGLHILKSLPNVNIINSIASDGGVNFGKADRISFLKENGYRVCPGVKNKEIKCGKNCFICMKIKKVCFPWHR